MQCIYCGHSKIHKRGKTKRGKEKYQRYICDKCQKSFSELAGTIYEDRHLTPTDIDLILEYQNQGMNFAQVARMVGVSPKAVSNLLRTTNKIVIDSTQSIHDQIPIVMIKIQFQTILLAILFGVSSCRTVTITNDGTAIVANPIETVSVKPNSGSRLRSGESKNDPAVDMTANLFRLRNGENESHRTPPRAASD
jgi:transposase-like protein